MTPANLSTLIFRFIALGVSIYGIILIASGVITHVESNRLAKMEELFGGESHDSSPSFGTPFAKVAGTLYIVGGGTVLAGSLLFLGSRRLGRLIARDL